GDDASREEEGQIVLVPGGSAEAARKACDNNRHRTCGATDLRFRATEQCREKTHKNGAVKARDGAQAGSHAHGQGQWQGNYAGRKTPVEVTLQIGSTQLHHGTFLAIFVASPDEARQQVPGSSSCDQG